MTGEDAPNRSRAALVTGAGGGIGAAIVQRLAADGIAVAALDLEPPTAVTEPLQAAGHAVIALGADVRDRAQLDQAVAQANAAIGTIDAAITAAGVQRITSSKSVPAEDWDFVIGVNLTGTWRTIEAVLPGMVSAKHGRVITISSEIALAGAPEYAAYSASKGGVVALTKTLAKELAADGIIVNSIAPGPIETGILLIEENYNDEWMRQNVPAGRWGKPDDVAATASFLLSGEADFFIGQIISPNGGVVI
ncbi:MAG: SDR family NAD(P)-dependent oxidoreductase [Solirubrobacteraceae bacterium]